MRVQFSVEHTLDMCKDIGSTLSATKIKILFKENKENYVCKYNILHQCNGLL